MFKKLIILFNKKNERAVYNQYISLLQRLKADMAKQGVAVLVNFVKENMDIEYDAGPEQVTMRKAVDPNSTSDVKGDFLYITDTPEHFDILKLWGYYVVAIIHDYNKNVTFRNVSYLIEGLEGLEYNYLDKVYRRMSGIPWDILETERLYVRESTVKDVDDFYRIYKEPSITYYMEDLFEQPDMERIYMKNYIKRIYGFYEYGMWSVILKETGEIVGRAGLSVRDGYDLPELGFLIEVAQQGKGLATEVCRAILDYARDELQMDGVQALVCAANVPSLALLRGLGFIFRENVTEGGQEYQLWIKNLNGD